VSQERLSGWRLGKERHAKLTEPERDLYFWILRRFATTGRPAGDEASEAARRFGVDLRRAVESLEREDLVHLDGDGEIAVAYPFSGRPTAHRVRFESGHEAYAMCALDALGIAPMFGRRIEVASRDPLGGRDIRVVLDPDGAGEWLPREAVVVTGSSCDGQSFRSCCPVLNFFESPGHAARWLGDHPDVRGEVVSMPEAIEAGRAVFGDVLAT
jgi:hypothetical protein